MAYSKPSAKVCVSRAAVLALVWSLIWSSGAFSLDHGFARKEPPGYSRAEDSFMQLNVDERVKLQILLTAAGYWPAVPDTEFSTRLFDAISRFEVDNGFVPLAILTQEQKDRLTAIAEPYLNSWGFEIVRHPMTSSQIWAPLGLPLVEEETPTGLRFVNRPLGVVLTYDYFPDFRLRMSFEALNNKLARSGARIYYSKLYKTEFFALSFSAGITDGYVRYHQIGRGGVGFSLYWNHAATEAHIERIATLISGSLWSSTTGAPFAYPSTVKPRAPETIQAPRSVPEAPPVAIGGPRNAQAQTGSGTGVYITSEGHIITNAHVVANCSEIRVGTGEGNFETARLVAKDAANDLALLKVNAKPRRLGALRFGVRLGEHVEAFGYPLSQVLATSGNFTTGNITALAGIGDDTRFYQISAPVQPGNSGGPLLDEGGNLIGIVSSKLNFLSEIKTQGDIPENVNFAIKASVAANFLQDNNIKFEIGEATQVLSAPDLADEAKALSAYIECRRGLLGSN
jgi:serine protease Do